MKTPQDPEYNKRYDWKLQRETKPTYAEMMEKESAQVKEDPFDWAKCTKPWKDPYAESDEVWQKMEDISEDHWREKRNEVMGWE